MDEWSILDLYVILLRPTGYISIQGVDNYCFQAQTVQIIEGTLSRIDIEGHDWFRAGYLRDRVERGTQTPLRM